MRMIFELSSYFKLLFEKYKNIKYKNMSCLISEGLNQRVCKTSLGGIGKLYITNKSDIAGFTDTTLDDGIINDIIFNVPLTDGFYEFQIDKNSSNATCVQAGSNNKYFAHTVDFFVTGEYAEMAKVNHYLRLGEFVAIVEMLDGTKILYGKSNGLMSTVTELNTGTASDDKSALHITLAGDQIVVAEKYVGPVVMAA